MSKVLEPFSCRRIMGAPDFGRYCAATCWDDSDKDELLKALLAAHEKNRMLANARTNRYKTKRYAADEQFRRHVNKVSAACQRQRYQTDPDYRERMKERARAWYRAKKAAAEV